MKSGALLCYKGPFVSGGTGRSLTWIAALLSLFLVFVLPACWSGAMTRAWTERGQGPQSNNTNEEREERELAEESDEARMAARPDPTPATHVAELPRVAPVFYGRTLVASVAAKPHPLRFSERSLC